MTSNKYSVSVVQLIMGDPVGAFYAHLVKERTINATLTYSTKSLTNVKKPLVIHFYDDG